MYTFIVDIRHALLGGAVTPFLVFFLYVWTVWVAKTACARRYRPFTDPEGVTASLRTTVIVPVYNEPEPVFRAVLASVRANDPTEIIVVVDGGEEEIVAVARDYADQVIPIAKAGKRRAIGAGLAVSNPDCEVVLVLDSDTVWADGMLAELLKPFADERVGGVTPTQRIIDPDANGVRRLADWIEDLRYGLTVPAQSVFGQVGCLAGRTIAYRRTAFVPAVEALEGQTAFGVEMHVGDDRVLTNEILRRGWRTVYQDTALCWTDAPNTWRVFWRQQLRWGRSSQRETFLSWRWLPTKPAAAAIFVNDVMTPFLVYALMLSSLLHLMDTTDGHMPDVPLAAGLVFAYLGTIVSIGLRQIPHFIRKPGDIARLPIFVLQLTFFMVPTRIAAFATMFHNGWSTREAPVEDRSSAFELEAADAPVLEGTAEPVLDAVAEPVLALPAGPEPVAAPAAGFTFELPSLDPETPAPSQAEEAPPWIFTLAPSPEAAEDAQRAPRPATTSRSGRPVSR